MEIESRLSFERDNLMSISEMNKLLQQVALERQNWSCDSSRKLREFLKRRSPYIQRRTMFYAGKKTKLKVTDESGRLEYNMTHVTHVCSYVLIYVCKFAKSCQVDTCELSRAIQITHHLVYFPR